MEVIDGDLRLCGWELRQRDPTTADKLGPVATCASALMSFVDHMADNVDLHEDTKTFPPVIHREDEDRFLRLGLIGPNFIDSETVAASLQGAPSVRESMAEEFYRRARSFRDLYQQVMLDAAGLEQASTNNYQWGLVSYKPGGGMRGTANGKASHGHNDHMPAGSKVKSTQLSETPTVWQLKYTLWPGYEKKSKKVVQEGGQVLVLESSHRHLSGRAATPWHYVENNSDQERLALLEFERAEAVFTEPPSFSNRRYFRWPLRRRR